MMVLTKKIVETHVHKQFHAMIAWAKQHFGFHHSWNPMLKKSFNTRRKYSYGGLYFIDNQWIPGVDLALNLTILQEDPLHYLEYEHYATDLEIGSIYFASWIQYIDAMICHELAHAVQHSVILRLKVDVYQGVLKNFTGDWQDDEHGELFQFILREFRREWMGEFSRQNIEINDFLVVDKSNKFV